MKTITSFMFILIFCIILGFVSYTASYSTAFEKSMNMVDDVSSFFARPFRSILNILGISHPVESEFTAYFRIRSTLDNQIIPKSNPYYDDLYIAVQFPAINFLARHFNNKVLNVKHTHHVDIILFFATDGTFLFGQCIDGRCFPFSTNDHPMTVDEWQLMFNGSYFDVKNHIAYIKAPGLDLDTKFQFKADGFALGIWQ